MITKTQPGAITPPKPARPGAPLQQEDPKTKMLQRRKEQIDKQLERQQEHQQKQEELKRQAKKIAQTFLKIAQPNPNDDPTGLFGQISGTLDKMGLKNSAERNKTELVIGKTNNKKESLYKILLRRNTEITENIVNKLNRASESLSAIVWTSNGMEAYVWGPYTPPAEENIPETPEI